jgi:hypothetical protein
VRPSRLAALDRLRAPIASATVAAGLALTVSGVPTAASLTANAAGDLVDDTGRPAAGGCDLHRHRPYAAGSLTNLLNNPLRQPSFHTTAADAAFGVATIRAVRRQLVCSGQPIGLGSRFLTTGVLFIEASPIRPHDHRCDDASPQSRPPPSPRPRRTRRFRCCPSGTSPTARARHRIGDQSRNPSALSSSSAPVDRPARIRLDQDFDRHDDHRRNDEALDPSTLTATSARLLLGGATWR